MRRSDIREVDIVKFSVCTYKEDINSIIYAWHEIEVGTALFTSFRKQKTKNLQGICLVLSLWYFHKENPTI